VEWIGWWLYTDLPTSLAWNAKRERAVPVPVIQEMAAALADPHFGPARAEGFATLCAVVPTHHSDLPAVCFAKALVTPSTPAGMHAGLTATIAA